MDQYQKQVQLELLEHESENRKRLTANYKAALEEIKKRIAAIMESSDFDENKMTRTKWNRMLEAQLQSILHRLGEKNVSDMTEYLNEMYKEGYLGCLYGIHQDGVGLILQINEDKVGRSINKKTEDLKFSERLYENADKLKEDVKAEMARGFSTGADYIAIARQVALRSRVSLSRAFTIARTEGHRVTEESRFDCMKDSAEKGADIVKQWDSTLDDVTRGTHRELDGQIRGVYEPFEIPSSGARAMYPGGFGIAKEDINCRCATLTRAKWGLGEEEYKYSREAGRNISIKSKLYSDWKNKYNKSADILFTNTSGKSDVDTIDDKIRLLEVLNELPARVTQSLLDVEYRFGEDSSRCDVTNGIVYLKQGTTKGHLLEKRLFDGDELYRLKKKYTEGLSKRDIVNRVYQTESGKDVNIYILKNDRFLDEYQGRLYITKNKREVNADGSINVDILDEFVSVMVPEYFLEPEKFRKEHEELYDFMRRYLE